MSVVPVKSIQERVDEVVGLQSYESIKLMAQKIDIMIVRLNDEPGPSTAQTLKGEKIEQIRGELQNLKDFMLGKLNDLERCLYQTMSSNEYLESKVVPLKQNAN